MVTKSYDFYKKQLTHRKVRSWSNGKLQFSMQPDGAIKFVFNDGYCAAVRAKLPWEDFALLTPDDRLRLLFKRFSTTNAKASNAVNAITGFTETWTCDQPRLHRLHIGKLENGALHKWLVRRRDGTYTRPGWQWRVPLTDDLVIDLKTHKPVHYAEDSLYSFPRNLSGPIYAYVKKCGGIFDVMARLGVLGTGVTPEGQVDLSMTEGAMPQLVEEEFVQCGGWRHISNWNRSSDQMAALQQDMRDRVRRTVLRRIRRRLQLYHGAYTVTPMKNIKVECK